MMSKLQVLPALVVMIALSFSASGGQSAEDLAQGTVWDLSRLYANSAAWENERASIESSLPELAQLSGTLGKDAGSLRQVLDRLSLLRQRLLRMDEYSALKASEDTSNAENQARAQTITSLQARFDESAAFVNPEILALGRERVEAIERQDPGLDRHRRELELILRKGAHTLSPEAESIVAATGDMRQAPNAIHDLLTYSDIPWPSVQAQGKSIRVDLEGYKRLIENSDREVRRHAFDAFTGTLSAYEPTLGSVLSAYLAGPAFEARVRHYPGSLALFVLDGGMPEDSFRTLASEAEKAVPIFNRYYRLRQKALGLDELRLYDLAVPLADDEGTYRLDEGEDLILKALAPLGSDYVNKLSQGFKSHVMHAVLAPHKPAGAFTYPEAYGVMPYVMVNYSGNYDSVSAVAHEWGHSMHAQLTQSTQPFENGIFSVFIGDTPSLTHELLLSDYMIAHAATRQQKIVALSKAIDLLRTYYYGVLLNARFELVAHEAADRGEPLTGQRFGQMYSNLLKSFYAGPGSPVRIGSAESSLWANVRIVYYDFYMYKYMTATSAAAYFVEGLENNDSHLREQYFDLLKAGGSDDAYLLLKRAGFDAASPEAYQPMIRRLDRLVRELEATLGEPESPVAVHASAPSVHSD